MRYSVTLPSAAQAEIDLCHLEHDQWIGMTREEADARTELYIADTQRKLGIHQ